MSSVGAPCTEKEDEAWPYPKGEATGLPFYWRGVRQHAFRLMPVVLGCTQWTKGFQPRRTYGEVVRPVCSLHRETGKGDVHGREPICGPPDAQGFMHA